MLRTLISPPRMLQLGTKVPAPVDAVWDAWTTAEGIKTFFAPDCNIELRPNGPYEIWFDPKAAHGSRGSEGARIMAIQPKTFFSFSWNFPPSLAEIREQQTLVMLNFTSVHNSESNLMITQVGWGDGSSWNAGADYFERAWHTIVLPRLQYRFEHGPIDWSDPPSFD